MAALDGAVALAEMDAVAVLVGEHLELDVLGVLDVALDEDLVAAEGAAAPRSARTAAGAAARPRSRTTRIPRPPPPAAALSISGNPASATKACASSALRAGCSMPGTTGTPARRAISLAFSLLPRSRIACGLGPMKAMPLSCARLGEGGILGEKAVSGMQRVHAVLLADVDELADVQVGVRGGRAPQPLGEVREHDVQRVGVGVAVHGDGLDAHLAAGADDAHRDLAPVRDEQAFEHLPILAPRLKQACAPARVYGQYSGPHSAGAIIVEDRAMRHAVICLLLCLAATGWGGAARAAHERSKNDKYAFDLVEVVTDIEMSKAKLTEDRPLVLFVWASDCPACIRHMPYAAALCGKLDKGAATFSSICFTKEKADALAFVDDKNLKFPVLWSGSGSFGDGFEYDGWPTTYVFRRGGKLEGIVDKSGPDYITEVLDMVDAAGER